MNLNEAIKYHSRKANTLDCPACADKHGQIADWLKELMAFRAAREIKFHIEDHKESTECILEDIFLALNLDYNVRFLVDGKGSRQYWFEEDGLCTSARCADKGRFCLGFEANILNAILNKEVAIYIVGNEEQEGNSKMRKFEYVTGADRRIPLPTRKTKASAGYDFYLPCDVTIARHGFSQIIKMGVKAKFPQDEVLMLHIRSSVGLLKHVTLANGTGIIDSDFYNNEDNEGEIGLVLQNNSDHVVEFHKGERVMQGVFVKYGVVDDDATTGERKGGIGHSGV